MGRCPFPAMGLADWHLFARRLVSNWRLATHWILANWYSCLDNIFPHPPRWHASSSGRAPRWVGTAMPNESFEGALCWSYFNPSVHLETFSCEMGALQNSLGWTRVRVMKFPVLSWWVTLYISKVSIHDFSHWRDIHISQDTFIISEFLFFIFVCMPDHANLH